MADERLDVRIEPCATAELIHYRVSRQERLEFAWMLQVLWDVGLETESARDFGIHRKTLNGTTFSMKALAKRPGDAPVVWLFFCIGAWRGRPTAVIIGCQGMCVMRLRSCREGVYRSMALRASRIQPLFD